jgi:hypothetical protein
MHLGVTKESFFVGDQSWIGSADYTPPRSITLDFSAFTKNTHYPNDLLKSGIPLGILTATGLAVPFNSAGTNGEQTLAGFLFSELDVSGFAATDDPSGALFYRGVVRTSRLPIAVNAAGQTSAAGRLIWVP